MKRRAFLIGTAAALATPYVALAASKNAKTDFGCLGNGTALDLANFQSGVNALGAAGGGTVEVPTGNYNLVGNVAGLQIPANVKLFGEGEGATILQAWYTDQSVVTILGSHSGLRDLTIYGKGTNSDPNPAANYPALRVTAGSVESKFENLNVWGGSHAIQSDGAVDNIFYGIAATMARQGAIVQETGANWYLRCKFDDGQNVSATGVAVTGTCGEVHMTQCDFSGSFTNNSVLFLVGSNAVGPPVLVISDSVLSSGVSLAGPGNWCELRGCELGGGDIALNPSWTGTFSMHGCKALGPGRVLRTYSSQVIFPADLSSDNYLPGWQLPF